MATNTKELNPIVRKIEKMLRLERDQKGTPEGETAARLARKMMMAHAIEMSSIDVDRKVNADPIMEKSVQTKTSVWRRMLASILAKHCNCSMSFSSRRGGKPGQTLNLYGHSSDIEVSKYLFDMCESQIESLAKLRVSQLPAWYDRGDKRTFGNSFRRSAVVGLNTKLKKIREDEASFNSEGHSLVSTRLSDVENWVKENQNVRRGKASSCAHNPDGYSAGMRVSLSAGVSGHEARRIAS